MKQRYKMRDFAAEHSLTLEKRCCYGNYKGYRIHVRYAAMGNPSCLITVVTDTKGRNKDLERFLEKNKKELKLTSYGVVGIGLMVCPQLYANIFRQVGEILDKIVRFLKKEGFPGAEICPYCGTPLDAYSVEMRESGIPFYAHEKCYERAYNAAREKERLEAEAPDHKVAGMGGAFLAAFAASVLFVLMFLWWNFAAVASAISILLGAFLYGKFGGKRSCFKIVSCALITLVVMLAIFLLCLVLQANQNMGGFDGPVFEKIVSDLINEESYRINFILNLAFIFVFDMLGTAYNIFSHLRSKKKISEQMQRMN